MTSPWKIALIAELSKRELLRPQIGVIMGVTSDTRHRRIQSMGKLLERRHDGRTHQVFYRLTRDQALVDAFLVAAEPRRIATRAAIDKVRNDPTRHLHILADDEAFVPKMHRGLPQADPKALPVEFFRAVEWELVEDAAPLMVTESPPCALFAAPRDITEVHS